MTSHNILNNSDNKFKFSVESNILYTKYNESNLFLFSTESNISLINITAPSYLFLNSSAGISYNDNKIYINSSNTTFNCDVNINGTLNATNFPNNIVKLDQNNKINVEFLPTTQTYSYNANSVSGDFYINYGRFGVGTSNPAYYCHINKNTNDNIQALAITNSNYHILDVYAEKHCVIINNSNGDLIDSNIKLNVIGTTKTTDLNVGNKLIVNENNTDILNDLYIKNVKSHSNIIYVDSNVDINVNNFSLKIFTSNLNDINNCFTAKNNQLTFNNNLSLNFNNNKIIIKNNSNEFIIDSNDIICNNLTTSNLKLLNTKTFTYNPFIESIADIQGKIRLFNDSEYTINNIYINNNFLYFTTINSNLFNYDLNSNLFNNIHTNFSYKNFRSKYDHYAYYNDSNLFLDNLITPSINDTIIDFAFNNSILYYINSNSNVVNYNIINKTTNINTGLLNIIKIDSYDTNEYIVLNNINELYNVNNTTGNITKIDFNINEKIVDFSCGYNHTLVLFNNGIVYSFGVNNLNKKKGISEIIVQNQFTTNNILLLNNLTNIFITKIKAVANNSILLDNNGYVYIFGFINYRNLNFDIYKIENIPKIIDIYCNNDTVILLSYFNDIYYYKYQESSQTIIKYLQLPDNFYGTSIKSRGSIVIGGNNFNKSIPKNSLLVDNCLYVGSNISQNVINTSNYSLIVDGNINIIGSIYNNGILFRGTGSSYDITPYPSTGIYNSWIKNNNNIYYNLGYVGIGTIDPKTPLHVNGNARFESNIYVNGTIITNEYKPWTLNNDSIYQYKKIGINTINPETNLHIYDGNLKITGVNINVNNSNIYNFENINCNISVVNIDSYKNIIAISENNSVIVSTYYKNSIYNNFIAKFYIYFNNIWNEHLVKNLAKYTTDIFFGSSVALSSNGGTVFIGSYNRQEELILSDSSTVYFPSGGIYIYKIINNEIINKDSPDLLTYKNENNTYIKIGRNICCSADGTIIISNFTDPPSSVNAYHYANKLLKKIIINNSNEILDFYYYSYFSIFNYDIILDCSFDTSTIIASFNLITLNYSEFNYYNFFIVKNNEIFLLKFYETYPQQQNSEINSVSISSDGKKILITNINQYYYVFNLDFNNIKNSYLNENKILINILDLIPIKYGLIDNTIQTDPLLKYKGKISKSGNAFTIFNKLKIINYKLNFADNIWYSNIVNNIDTNINNANLKDYYISSDFKSYNYAISYICNDYNIATSNDNITVYNKYLNLYNEIDIITTTNSNINITTDLYTNKIITQTIFGDGSNLLNIQLSNINNSDYINGAILYSSNNKIKQTSNFVWNDNKLIVSGEIQCDFINSKIDLSNVKSILSLSNGGLGNNVFNENQILFSSLSNINGTNNLIWNNSNSNLIINGHIITKNIVCSNISGNGNNITNINYKNIVGVISLSNGGLGINSINDGEILIGNNTNSIKTNSNIKWISESNQLNVNGNINATHFIGSFIGDGAGITSIPFGVLNGIANVYNGGTGLSNIDKGVILYGNQQNDINNIKLSASSNFLFTGTDLYVNNYVFANKFNGNGEELSNLNANNITGKISIAHGGIGNLNISNGNIFVGDIYSNISVSTKLTLLDSNLYLDGTIYACNINASDYSGDGYKLTNLNASNLTNIIRVNNGGTGKNNHELNKLLIGNGNNPILSLSNIEWNNDNNAIIFNNDATININKPIILSAFLSNLHISEVINTSNGGTGNSNFDNDALIYYNEDKITSISNIKWNKITSNFNLTGNVNITQNLNAVSFIGNGYELSNLNAYNLSNIVRVNNGGTGKNSYNTGQLLYGNGTFPIESTSNLKWYYDSNTLQIANGSIIGLSNLYAFNLYGNGSNITNIQTTNLSGIISLSNGGLGINIIGSNELLIGNTTNSIKSDSNIKWLSQTKELNISSGIINVSNLYASNLYGNGSNIKNIQTSNLNGIISVLNGGTGSNFYRTGELLYGNSNNILLSSPNLLWSNNSLNINGNITTSGNITSANIYGNGLNITNLNPSYLLNAVPVNKGGTGLTTIGVGQILYASEFTADKFSNSDFFVYKGGKLGIGLNNPIKNLDVIGDINFSGDIYKNNVVFTGEKDFKKYVDNSNVMYTSNSVYIGYSNIDSSIYDVNFKVKIDGNMYVSGDITGLSDIRFKNNILLIDNPIEKIKQLNGVYYNFNDKNDLKRHIGLIAQDVEKILPEAVYTNKDDTKSLAYGNMMGLVIESIKSIVNRLEIIENYYIKNLY